jgi:hypothetical protein
MGRPSEYTPELATRICAEVAAGRSVRSVCREEDFPGERTVFAWLSLHDDFQQQYARAKEASADCHADEIIEIADDDSLPADDRRVRIDARKWVASKLKPRRYGDKIAAELTGKDGAPIELRDTSTLEAARRVAFLLTQGAALADKSPATETP